MREEVLKITDRIGCSEDKMIELLIELQKNSRFNYLSEETIKAVSEVLDIPKAKVFGVTKFYSMLSTEKRGQHVIGICNSGPCYINNGQGIVKIFEDILGIKMGEVTPDGMFSLEYSSCIGACDMSPGVKINEKTFGNLDRGIIFNLLASLKRGESI